MTGVNDRVLQNQIWNWEYVNALNNKLESGLEGGTKGGRIKPNPVEKKRLIKI